MAERNESFYTGAFVVLAATAVGRLACEPFLFFEENRQLVVPAIVLAGLSRFISWPQRSNH